MDWMKESLFLAEQAFSIDEVPVGAVVVYEGQVIGRGHNEREKRQSPTAHAEILALEQAAAFLGSWRLTNCILVVTLEPCMMCLAACQQARINEVIYGAQDPKGGALSLGYSFHEDLRTNHRFVVRLAETSDCSGILTRFFAAKRAKKQIKSSPR